MMQKLMLRPQFKNGLINFNLHLMDKSSVDHCFMDQPQFSFPLLTMEVLSVGSVLR
jgi:hypothetical protein